MKVIKRLFMLFIVLFVTSLSVDVFALNDKDIYYTNDYYVSFTKEEYDFVSKFYFDGYQKLMNQEQYNYMIDNNLMEGEIKIQELADEDVLLPRADTSYTTGTKKIKLSSSCGTTCNMTITVTWMKSANVRSYDLVGAYSPTSGSLKFVNSLIYYDGTSTQYKEYRQDSHGVSATMKLPSSGENIVIMMDFKANKGTLVHAGYQHAKKSISLTNSRKYSFLGSGYGGVFLFDDSVSSYYDAMGGVKMTL